MSDKLFLSNELAAEQENTDIVYMPSTVTVEAEEETVCEESITISEAQQQTYDSDLDSVFIPVEITVQQEEETTTQDVSISLAETERSYDLSTNCDDEIYIPVEQCGSCDGLQSQIDKLKERKQDKLTAGDNITISADNVISADDTTYILSKSGSTITLTASDGTTYSVSDDNTTYGLKLLNGQLFLVEGGTTDSVTIPDNDTTYSVSISGHTLTLNGSDGSTSSVTVPDDDTTYTLSINGHTLTLTSSSGTAQSITLPDDDTDTKVTQTNTTDTAYYRLLLSQNANDTTETNEARKSFNLRFSPGNGQLVVSNVTSLAPFLADLTTKSTDPAAGENVNILAAQFHNADGTKTHRVYPVGILGNDNTSNNYNSGVRLGSTNGTTVVGAGESSVAFAAAQAKYDDENLYLTADGHVYMYVQLSNDATTHQGQWLCGGYTATPTTGQVVISDGTHGGYKTSGFTIGKSVPSNAVFTDTTYTATKENIGSASAGTAISADDITSWDAGSVPTLGTNIAADDITSWTTNTPTKVTKKTVVTGGSTTSIPNISKKTVVTSATAAKATYSAGVLTISDGSVTTGDSVTVGTAIKAYTSLTTGDSVDVTAGTAATLKYTARSIPNVTSVGTTPALSYTSRSIPNISVTTKSVVTDITAN